MCQTLGGIYLTLYRGLDEEEEEVTVKYDDTVIVVALEVNLAYEGGGGFFSFLVKRIQIF